MSWRPTATYPRTGCGRHGCAATTSCPSGARCCGSSPTASTRPDAGWRRAFLASVRVLGEGVDITGEQGVEAVCFADTRGSQVEIVQNIGRALRLNRDGSTKMARIIVPIFLEPNEDPTDIAASASFRPLVAVLQSLRSHDERLVEQLASRASTGTNSPWLGLPDELGTFQTAHKRLIRWAVDGTWERILTAVLAAADADDDLDWTVSVDSTVVRAHQHAAGTHRGAPDSGEAADHALGRSCGGLGTKVHLAADGPARPLAFTITAGQACDAPAFETVMARIRVPRTGLGRPRTRPLTVLADRPYSSCAIRSHLRRRGIHAVIPQPSDQVGHRLRRGRLGGRPPSFDSEAYKQRTPSSGASIASSSGAAWPHEPTSSQSRTRPHSWPKKRT